MKKHTYITTIDVGRRVVCDVCNEEYTDREDSGGFLFNGEYSYCPVCAEKSIKRIREYGEEKYITVRCPKGMSFRDFVYKLRGGDGGGTIQIVGQ
jgi:hypothetical protein